MKIKEKRGRVLEYNYIIEGNSESVLKELPSNFVDIVITSPPYNVAHNYDNFDDNMKSDEYWLLMKDIFNEIYRVLKSDGRICLNVPFAIKNRESKKVAFLATKFAGMLNEIGFDDFEWITWHKGRSIDHFQGNNTAWGSWKSPSSPSFRPMGEAVLVFYKSEKRMVRDKENIDISGDEFKNWTKNVWYFDEEESKEYKGLLTIPNNASKKIHPAPYPDELVERLLKMYSYKEAIVLDPFNGIGTTSFVSEKLNRSFIGIEQSKIYCDLAAQRVGKKTTKRLSFDPAFSKLVHPGEVKGTLNHFFPYKESYNPNLLQTLIDKYQIKDANSVYDPFTGTGSTFTNSVIKHVYGVDVSPFALSISVAKLKALSEEDYHSGVRFLQKLKELEINEYDYPEWTPYYKYADKYKYNVLQSVMSELVQSTESFNLFVRAVIFSNLETIFDYKRDGNGIKYRESKIHNDDLMKYLIDTIELAIKSKKQFDKDSRIESIDLKLRSSVDNLPSSSIDLVLTSPPYANMFDYFEVYKMELWTSGHVNSYQSWKNLKKTALRSNYNADLRIEDKVNNRLLNKTIDALIEKEADNRTIVMLNNYFYDMKLTLENIYNSLKVGGYAFIVVGNSFYKGVPVPTDFIIEEIANKIGFESIEIIVARKLSTSPQQMKIINDKDRPYLRESIIVLRRSDYEKSKN